MCNCVAHNPRPPRRVIEDRQNAHPLLIQCFQSVHFVFVDRIKFSIKLTHR